MRNIRQNLFFAFIYNALGVPVAAGVISILRNPPLAYYRSGSDGAFLRQRGREFIETPKSEALAWRFAARHRPL